MTITVTGSTETLEETVGVKSEGASAKGLAWASLPFEGETSGAGARVTFEVWSEKSAAYASMSRSDKRKDVNEVYEGLKTDFQGLCLNAKRKSKLRGCRLAVICLPNLRRESSRVRKVVRGDRSIDRMVGRFGQLDIGERRDKM